MELPENTIVILNPLNILESTCRPVWMCKHWGATVVSMFYCKYRCIICHETGGDITVLRYVPKALSNIQS